MKMANPGNWRDIAERKDVAAPACGLIVFHGDVDRWQSARAISRRVRVAAGRDFGAICERIVERPCDRREPACQFRAVEITEPVGPAPNGGFGRTLLADTVELHVTDGGLLDSIEDLIPQLIRCNTIGHRRFDPQISDSLPYRHRAESEPKDENCLRRRWLARRQHIQN